MALESKLQSLFIDEISIDVRSGDGGSGCISFRREKYVPRGGPDGGDGGNGAGIIIRASQRIHTLLDQKYLRSYRAPKGAQGRGSNQSGKSGQPLVIEVPVGTLVYDEENKQLLADLNVEQQEIVAARGGKGGKGNAAFATATVQAPRIAQPGQPGSAKRLRLELKLMADVGLVGYPNSGKSTLISSISAAKPKIADYPFTTLVPHLGIVAFPGYNSLVFADIPGIIENAHEGSGLGLRFLRHIERTRFLIILLDLSPLTNRDIEYELTVLLHELAAYSPELAAKPFIIAGNKTDLPEHSEKLTELQTAAARQQYRVFPISAATGAGVPELLRAVWRHFAP